MTKPSEHFRNTIREYLEQRASADALFAASCADVGRPLDCRVVVNHTIVLTEEEQREAHEQALRKATDEAYVKITHKSKSKPASNAANAVNQQSLF